MNKTVDIIIPVYNTPAKLLRACILSVLKQTYDNISVLVIDDGSTNKNTLKVVEEFSKSRNIAVYKQANSGVSNARNKGLKCSKGDYIYFLDADDNIDQDQIKILLRIAASKKSDLVFAGKVRNRKEENDAPFKDHAIDLEKDSATIAIKAHAFTSQGVLINGSIARSLRFRVDSVATGEDTEFIIKAMTKGKSYFYGHGGYNYMVNPDSKTAKTDIFNTKRYIDESILLADIFQKHLKIDSEIKNEYIYLKLLRAFWKLSLVCSRKEAKNIITAKICEKNISKVEATKVLRSSLLGKYEKIRIVLLNYGLFNIVYYLNRFIYHVKKTNK